MVDSAADWVLVCGGFHEMGGMDRANAALAEYLSETGARVHLVAHEVAPAIAARPGISTHVVPRRVGSVLGGELALARRSEHVTRVLHRAGRQPLVIANGGNVRRADVNWVHSVHHAWPPADAGAPAWFKVKNRGTRWWYKRRERIAVSAAKAVIANSERTRRDLVEHLDVDEARVHTVYLGSAPDWRVAWPGDRARARARWSKDPSRPLIAFVGALGHDTNKGIDTLLAAWARLRRRRGPWDAALVVAGPGRSTRWERLADDFPNVQFVGFTDRIGDLLDAADLLVSPVRYEAYGLAVHEAICRGVPVLTTTHAGIVERFGGRVDDLLLERADDPDELASRLLAWRSSPAGWRDRFDGVREALTAYSMRDMAMRIAALTGAAVGG